MLSRPQLRSKFQAPDSLIEALIPAPSEKMPDMQVWQIALGAVINLRAFAVIMSRTSQLVKWCVGSPETSYASHLPSYLGAPYLMVGGRPHHISYGPSTDLHR